MEPFSGSESKLQMAKLHSNVNDVKKKIAKNANDRIQPQEDMLLSRQRSLSETSALFFSNQRINDKWYEKFYKSVKQNILWWVLLIFVVIVIVLIIIFASNTAQL